MKPLLHLATLVAIACASPRAAERIAAPAVAPASAPLAAAGPITSHVIVISVDGLRPDAIATYGAHLIERLEREGAASLEARTILPSVTLPSHASMLTGVEPAKHGITWNDDEDGQPGTLKVPTIFALAHEAGLHTAAFFAKSKLGQLEAANPLGFVSGPPRGFEVRADRLADEVVAYLNTGERPNLLFIHFPEPDRAGHSIGWMTPAYGKAVVKVDADIETLLQAADSAFGKGAYTLILTADHGGHGRSHGSPQSMDVHIPWIAWGQGVVAGHRLTSGIRTTDTAATALWLLGVPIPAWMTGKPVGEAFGK